MTADLVSGDEGDTAVGAGGDTPAAPGSALEAIRRQRTKKREGVSYFLNVPGTAPTVVVQYAPITQVDIDKVNIRAREAGDDDGWMVEGYAIHLAKAARCIGEVVDGKFRTLDPKGRPLIFNDRLRELLEVDEIEAPTAQSLVRILYAQDGDVISAAMKLTRLSGFGEDVAEAELAGN